MVLKEFWIQIENRAWDLSPNNKDRMRGKILFPIPSDAPTKELFSPVTLNHRTPHMFNPLMEDALILRRYTQNWAAPDDRKVNPWDLNEPDPTDNGTMGTIPGPVIECNVGDKVKVHFRNMDSRIGKDDRSRTHSLHPHGFVFSNAYDGAFPLSPPDPTQPVADEATLWEQAGVTVSKKGDRVPPPPLDVINFPGAPQSPPPPGGTFTYTWETLSWPTTAGVWLYHDHSICDTHNMKLGAIGIIVIHNPNDPDDVVSQDLPDGSLNGYPVEFKCTDFGFTVPLLPHDLNILGMNARDGTEVMLMSGEPDKRINQKKDKKTIVFKRGNTFFEADLEARVITGSCTGFFRRPPDNARYLLLFHNLGDSGMCINGRKFMGNTPTIVAGQNTKMRFGVVGMGDFDGFHTFHIHGHRWIIPGPDGITTNDIQNSAQVRAVSQFEDTKVFGPANSFSFTMNPGSFMRALPPELGEWHMHCHVLGHMMDGMMGSLLIVSEGALASDLPMGDECPEDMMGARPPAPLNINALGMGMMARFEPNDISVQPGSTIRFNFVDGPHTVITHNVVNATAIRITQNDRPDDPDNLAVRPGPDQSRDRIIQGSSGGRIDFHCGVHGIMQMSGTIHLI